MNKKEEIKKLFFDEYSSFGEIEIIKINDEKNIIKVILKLKNKSIIRIETKINE